MTAGEFTDLPPKRKGENLQDWDALCLKAKRRPGNALLVAEGVPMSLANSLRQRDRAPFYTHEGMIRVYTRNTQWIDGKRHVDIYFIWHNH